MKIPRKFELNESAPFFNMFSQFWKNYKDCFPHIDPNDILFLKDEIQTEFKPNYYMEIKSASRDVMLVLPEVRYLLIVYPSFNFLNFEERDFYFYNCLFQIPKGYKSNPRLKEPDLFGFLPVIEKFRKTILEGRK